MICIFMPRPSTFYRVASMPAVIMMSGPMRNSRCSILQLTPIQQALNSWHMLRMSRRQNGHVMHSGYLMTLAILSYAVSHIMARCFRLTITYPVSLSQIIGYNIYRDGKKIGNVDANITSYDDTTAGGGVHSYNATVVYGVGESEFSNAFSITTGINNVTAEKETKNIYTIGGIRLPQTQKTRKGLFIVDGRKKIVR